jgi:murein DD-endopeptidase MepM/ murein hydrolase activator NlpD
VELARLAVDGTVIFTREIAATLGKGGIKDAAPPTPEHYETIELFEALKKDFEETQKKKAEDDAATAEADAKALIELTKLAPKEKNGKPLKPVWTAPKTQKPKPPLPDDVTTAAYTARRLWEDYLRQIKGYFDVKADAEASPDAQIAQLETELKGALTISGWDPKTPFSLKDAAHRAHLNTYLNKTAQARNLSSGADGIIKIPLPWCEPGKTNTIRFELAGHKFTKPLKEDELPRELGLELTPFARSAHFDHSKKERDWYLDRQQESAWTIHDTKQGKQPLHNWYEVSHTWTGDHKAEPFTKRVVLALQWSQPAWYVRRDEHGPIPIHVYPKDSPPKPPKGAAAPIVDGTPTMLVSTSGNATHGRYYGEFGNKGRADSCDNIQYLWTWTDPKTNELWYQYRTQERVFEEVGAETHPPEPPYDGVPSVLTFKCVKAAPDSTELVWVQKAPSSGGMLPPHTVEKLAALDAQPEGTEIVRRVYRNGTKDLAKALNRLYSDTGDEWISVCDQHRRAIIAELDRATNAVQRYRVVNWFKGGGMRTDPKYTDWYPGTDAGLSAAQAKADYRWHQGIDIAGFTGQAIFSMLPGTANHSCERAKGEVSGEGGGVVTVKAARWNNQYLHNEVESDWWKAAEAAPGKAVKAGDVIALMGRTGAWHDEKSATHVHMQGGGITQTEAWAKGQRIDMSFPDSHADLLPHNLLPKELICQAEYGSGTPKSKLNWVPVPRTANKCFGRTGVEGDPVPPFWKPIPPFKAEYPGCWALNEGVCPKQAEVQAEKTRQENEKKKPAKKAATAPGANPPPANPPAQPAPKSTAAPGSKPAAAPAAAKTPSPPPAKPAATAGAAAKP